MLESNAVWRACAVAVCGSQPALFRSLADREAVLAAASAFWRAPAQPVDLDPKAIEGLPFVNRVPNLESALEALMLNQGRSWMESGDRRYTLLFCAQLFGMGKTSFGKRLAEGLKAGVAGRLAYHR